MVAYPRSSEDPEKACLYFRGKFQESGSAINREVNAIAYGETSKASWDRQPGLYTLALDPHQIGEIVDLLFDRFQADHALKLLEGIGGRFWLRFWLLVGGFVLVLGGH